MPLLLGDGATSYLYDDAGNAVEQIDAAGGALYYQQDQLGSTRLLTDQTGAVAATFSYDAYGNLTGHTGSADTPLRWNGQYQDPASGLYYLRARYYDPQTAQFLSRDPIAGLTQAAYAYADESPLNLVDPAGLSAACATSDLSGMKKCKSFGSFMGTLQWIIIPTICAVDGEISGPNRLTIDKIFKDPSVLAGKSPQYVQQQLGKLPSGWEEGTLGKGSRKGQGYALRQRDSTGNLTGAVIRWHPGGGHHGDEPYWVVSAPNAPKTYVWPK